jgi:hypothetical protein
VNYPKEKILAGFDGRKRKWTLFKIYKNFGLYKCGEIRECFSPHELGMIEKKNISKKIRTEGNYWEFGNRKTMREYINYLQEIELLDNEKEK